MAIARSTVPPPGVYTPMLTFFNHDESIDLESTALHSLRMAEAGCVGVVIQGSNGEAVHLDNEERVTIIRTVRAALDKGGYNSTVIVAGIGTQSKKQSVTLAREAHAAGARFGLLLPPSYWAAAMQRPVLEAYFKDVADESPLPIVIYNFPAVANGVNIDSDLMIALAQHPNIVGAKLTCGSMGTLNRVCANVPPTDFACLGGKAEFALQSYVGGSPGLIAALANLSPKVLVAQYNAYMSGDLARAQELQRLLADADLAQTKLAIPGLKAAVVKYFGYGSPRTRSPLLDGDMTKVDAQAADLDKLMALEKSL